MSDGQEKRESQESNTKEEMKASLSKMASLMLHEIHIPLNAIMGNASSLKKYLEKAIPQDERMTSDAYENCRRIEETSQMLVKIIRSLTLLEKEEPQEAFVLTAIGDIVRSTLELSRILFIKTGVQFYFDQTQTLEFPLECRPHEIVQVLLNLIKNAVEAVENLEDQKEKWVRLEIKKKGIHIYFKVLDSGHGIDPKFESKIFEPFFTTKAKKVNGIGLYLSRKIVESHGGELMISKDSEYTAFLMKLPILQGAKS